MIVGRGCLGRPWLFRELAQAFDGEEPDLPPRFGEIVEIMLEHGRRLVELFGEGVGVRQMRKWTAWYTKGFHGSASVRGKLMRINSLDDLAQTVSELDMAEPFPVTALRAQRAGLEDPEREAAGGLPRRSRGRHAAEGPRTLEEISPGRRPSTG